MSMCHWARWRGVVLAAVGGPHPGSSGLLAEVVVGAAGVSGMAIQTAVTRLAGYLFPTNMVTSTMTQLGMDTAGLLFLQHRSGEERAVVSRRAREYARVVAGFGVGAALAAVLTSYVDFWAAAVPLAVIALAAHGEFAAASRQSVATGEAIQ